MVGALLNVALCVLAVPEVVSLAQADADRGEQFLQSAFLFEGDDGQVWVSEAIVSLGMVGVGWRSPIRLSPEIGRRLAPLITKLDPPSTFRTSHWRGKELPATNPGEPFILLGLRVRMIVGQNDTPAAASQPTRWSEREVLEIVEARAVSVEFVSSDWHDALTAATQGLEQIVSISRSAPNDQKKQPLEEVVAETARLLEIMEKAQPREEWLARARQVGPTVRVSRLFQRKTREHWQDTLERCAERLGVAVPVKLPLRLPRFDSVKLLADSDSPEDLIAKVQATWSEDMLDVRLVYSGRLDRTFYLHEVTGMASEEFDALRADARKQLLRREERAAASAPASEAQSATVDGLHITIRRAEPELLAAKLVLGGLVVEQVTDSASGLGLKTGDVILDYGGIYDVVMATADIKRSAQWLANKATHGGELTVLRKDQLLTITLPGTRPSGRQGRRGGTEVLHRESITCIIRRECPILGTDETDG